MHSYLTPLLIVATTLALSPLPSSSLSTATRSGLLLPQTSAARIAVPPVPTLAPPPITSDHDLLLRAARGEQTERTPIWMMRQAGRYMPSFRKYSDNYPFRVRSETPEVAVELSLQCVEKVRQDGAEKALFPQLSKPYFLRHLPFLSYISLVPSSALTAA